jgi:hypothetical protein
MRISPLFAVMLSAALVTAGTVPLAYAGAGDVIPVPTDKIATYVALDITHKPAGVVEVITERGSDSGDKGHFFTIRDCDCPASKYRILGQGKTMEEARRRYPSDGSTELVEGSVSYDICKYACATKPPQ